MSAIFVSRFTQRKIATYALNAKKISKIPNGKNVRNANNNMIPNALTRKIQKEVFVMYVPRLRMR